MRKNGGKKIKDLNLFAAKEIKITGNRVAPHNEFIEFKKQDIHRSIAGYFEGQVRKYPQNTALKTKNRQLTYRQLSEKSNQAAHAILNLCGQEPGGALLLFEHGAGMIVGILSALKANKYYVPLEPSNPAARLLYIIEDTNAKILITNNKNTRYAGELIKKTANQIKIINIDTLDPGISIENPGLKIHPQSPAYILYTSGSTGKPKGVIQAQKNVLHHAGVYINNLHIHAGDRLTLFSSYGFDAAVMDIFGALLSGAALYILSVLDQGNLENLPGWLREEQITIYHSVPTLYRYFVNGLDSSDTFPHLRFIVLGGDVVYKKDVQRYKEYFSRDCLFINGLGPTESTVTLQYFIDKQTAGDWETVPVGFPVDETSVPLLDENNREAQIFSTGEIVYKSDYLALGYTNMPEKTAEVFVTDPLTGHGRVFRSGDFGRLLEDGNIEFLGRIDRQVKIRGFRVDLGEIESRLLGHKEIKETVVVSFESEQGENYLCAYFVPAAPFGKIPGNGELKEYLADTLPDYMIPSSFTKLDKIPLTPRGKIDRKALPVPGIKAGKKYIAPANKTQEKLAAIWAEVLGIDKDIISMDSNFFQLGGHSLKATLLISRIYKETDVQIPLVELFKTPTIMELAEYMHRTAPGKFVSLRPLEKKEYHALSPAQQRLYVLHRFEVNSTAYNLPNILSLEGNINKDTLEETFKKLISRHESLRTLFIIVGNEPVQVIHDEVEFEIEYDRSLVNGHWSLVNCQGRGEVPSPIKVEKIITNFIRPFDLAKAPLLRVGLIKEEETKYILAIDIHHIITDGLSQQILVRDFISLYAGQQLPPLRVLYKEYSQWQQSKEVQNRLAKQEESWLKEFQEQVPVLVMSTDYPRPALQSFEGNIIDFTLKVEETGWLDAIAHTGGATLFMVILAIYNIFLLKISNQEDIVVGTPIAGRRHADLEKVVGMFVNTLPLRNYPTGEKTFNIFLKEIKEKTIKAFENQDYQFEDMVEKIVVERDMSRNPLFDVMFMFQDLSAAPGSEEIPAEEIKGLKIKPYQYELRVSKFDLSLIGVKRGEKLYFTFEYCTKLFKQETIQRFIKYFLKIVSAVTANPETKISGIEIITGEEKKQLLYDFNDTRMHYPKEKTIHQLFAEQVERTPNQVSLIGAHELHELHEEGTRGLAPLPDLMSITYRELNEKSRQLGRLLQEKGVQPDNIVGIKVGRSVEMIIGILGILKAGGAYLPIEPDYPQDRIDYMLKDSGAKILLTSDEIVILSSPEAFNNRPKGTSSFGIWNLEFGISPRQGGHPAYVIYTSGSTGKPKGVMLEHRSVNNFITGITSIIPFTKDDRILSLTTISFDIFGLETLVPLARGPVVVIGSKEEQMGAAAAARVMERERIGILQVTPSRLRLLMAEDKAREALKCLTYLLVGGEAFPALLLEKVRKIPVKRIFNLYGPTETTIWSTVKDVSAKEVLNIGKPIANTGIYILSKDGCLQPGGVPGELCISGHGLARGYINNPELTTEKFDQDLWDYQDYHDGYHRSYRSYRSYITHKSYLYRTGDLARWLPDGNIEYLQRIDHQVKIRGYRIELEEIENRLSAFHEIKETVVISKTNEMGDTYLCAYFISDREIQISGIREYLSAYLPDYMIPSYFVKLDKMPLNQNGKIDRKALPEPEAISLRDSVEYVPPTNDIEKKLVEIWEKVLGRDQIGINENFFLAGGDSIKSIQVISRMKSAGYQLKMTELFKHPVISKLAPHVKKTEGIPDQSVSTGTIPLTSIRERLSNLEGLSRESIDRLEALYPDAEDLYALTPMQEGMLFHALADESSDSYFVQISYRLQGELNINLVEKSLNELFKRHDILRTAFVYRDIEFPVQVVLKDRSIDFYYQDIGKIGEKEKKENVIKEFKEKDKKRSFDLNKDVLMRVSILRAAKSEYEFTWSFHHILMDGWCLGILNVEFLEIYTGFLENRPYRLPVIKPYRTYIQWLEKQDREASAVYWQNYLESFEGPTGVAKTQLIKKRDRGYGNERVSIVLNREKTSRLIRLSARHHVTLNTLTRTVWGLLLGKYNGKEDVVFGAVVSGRPFELTGVESMVGLFINTIPVRIRFTGTPEFHRLLEKAQEQAIASQPHHYQPLAEIQSNTPLKQNLIDHLFIFENYPIAKQIEGYAKEKNKHKQLSLKLTDVEDFQQSNYDFNVVLTGSERLRITFQYNGNVYDSDYVKGIAKHFSLLIDQVIHNDKLEIGELTLLTEEEKNRVLYEFNKTEREYPKDKTIQQLFREEAERNPEQPAVSSILDITGIYEKMKPGKIDNHFAAKLENFCFKKNPYVFRYRGSALLEAIDIFSEKENKELIALRTQKLNYVAVNQPVLSLLDYFDGKINLKSIFKGISGKGLLFLIYNIKKDSEETDFYPGTCERITIKENFHEIVLLANELWRANLIEFGDYNPDIMDLDITMQAYDRANTPERTKIDTNELAQHKGSPMPWGAQHRGAVLLLGDRTGPASTGLLYIASFLRRNGIEAYCQWNDINITEVLLKNNVEKLLAEIQPGIVGVSMKWFPHIARVLEICKIVKAYDPSIIVVVGGNTASYYNEKIIRYDCVDYVLSGDGEVPMLQLCRGVPAEEIPNCVYKGENGKTIKKPITYVQDEKNSTGIYLSHLDKIFVSKKDPYLASFFYICTGKGCMMQCFYCGGCRDAQVKTFSRVKPFMRGVEEVRNDIIAAKEYTGTLWFDFDLPAYDSLDYYQQIWEGLDLSGHFCEFYFWKLPTFEFLDYVVGIFKYVYFNVDLCSLSERHRLELSSLGVVKPQPTDEELFAFFEQCAKYDNIEVIINQITGLPLFTSEDIDRSHETLSKLLNKYSFLKAMDWGRLHAQPGAPIVDTCQQYDMHSYAGTFEDFLKYSQLNWQEQIYPVLLTFNYPYIYSKDDTLNSQISKLYVEANKQVEKYREEKIKNLTLLLKLTYAQLDEKSNRLTKLLRAKGVKPGDIVGVMMERSSDMIAALLAILKLGAAYLPIDPDYPRDRIDFMLKDSNAKILLTSQEIAGFYSPQASLNLSEGRLFNSHHSSFINHHSKILAYVIYTSGSTGRPKGVMVEHGNVVRLVKNSDYIDFQEGRRLLMTGTIVFDITTFEIWGPLLNGLNLYLVNKETILDAEKLKKAVVKNEISILHLIPQLFYQVLEQCPETFAGLEYFLVGGDLVRPGPVQQLRNRYPHIKIIHCYGPTENTTFSTTLHIDKDYDQRIPIGKPIGNSKVYILDKYGQLQSIGTAGELCTGGDGVSRGYLNNPELTAEMFILATKTQRHKDVYFSWCPGALVAKLYRTGDLARWLPDGNIEFLGRIDSQVKIRGFRIELEEIENRLLEYHGIKEAVVIVRQNETGENDICAYITAPRQDDIPGIREYLSEKLPSYMIPNFFVPMDKFPLTPNGKLDRNALPGPGITAPGTYIAPGNEIEEKLVEIWSEILGIEKEMISIDSNFFDLGGHSLKATRVAARIYKEFEVKASPTEILKKPTIAELAPLIEFVKWGGQKKTDGNEEREEILI